MGMVLGATKPLLALAPVSAEGFPDDMDMFHHSVVVSRLTSWSSSRLVRCISQLPLSVVVPKMPGNHHYVYQLHQMEERGLSCHSVLPLLFVPHSLGIGSAHGSSAEHCTDEDMTGNIINAD